MTPDHDVAIIGGGFSGIGAAILLDKAGFDDYLMIEEGDGVGGAWHWNTYPGVAVDIPSFSYQFSFEQMAGWSRVYAPGRELKAIRRALRRQVRRAPAHPAQHPGRGGRLRRRRRPVAARAPRPATPSPPGTSSARPAC